MKIKGSGSLEQLDKTKTPYRCKEWRLWVSTSRGRKSKRFKGGKADALKELDRFITQLENDEFIATKKFSDYAWYWYSYRQNTQEYSPNTLKTDYKYIKKLNLLFGNKNLTDLSPQLIRDKITTATWENNKMKKLSGTSKNHMYFTLNQILNMAKDDELLIKNPCDKVKPPKKDTQTKRALDKQERDNLLKALNSEPFDGRVMFIYLMLLAGLRRGEAVALNWKDWDRKNGVLNINKAFKDADSSVGPTKTKAGTRQVPVNKQLENLLIKWEEKCKNEKIQSDYICCNTHGNIMSGGSCYKWWRELKNKYKIPDICYHELRHTNLTVVKNHLNVFDLKDYAGWEDIEMARIYIHKDIDSMKKGISQVEI